MARERPAHVWMAIVTAGVDRNKATADWTRHVTTGAAFFSHARYHVLMSTTTETDRRIADLSASWQAGVVGGVAGALAMGALVVMMNTPTVAVAIPSLYGLAPPPNPAVGLFVHVSHGAVLGVLFAALVGILGIDSPTKTVALGAGWGVLTWIALAALLMPVWLGAIGSPASPPFPNFAPPSLLWHLVYGVVLGGVYVALEDTL